MKNLVLKYFPLLLIAITLFSVQQWLSIPISTTFISWGIDFCITFIILFFKSKFNSQINKGISRFDRKLVTVYLLWMLFNIIRGVFIAENYWEWKQLIGGGLSLSLPIFVYVFLMPLITTCVLRYWFKYALFIFIIILPFLGTDAYHFYLGPIFLLGCFIPVLPKQWKIIIGGLLVIMLFIDWGARSQLIKSAVVLLVALGIYYRHWISINILKTVHWICYAAPIILLILGISGTFNIFEDLASNEGKYVERKIVDGKVIAEDLSADTRTFLYQEVITSALKHHYVIWGRTPARGNDSKIFGKFTADELKTGKFERHFNEVCHINVFTWSGLVGIILYSLIYLRSSYLAVYKSNNIYIKYLGCFIAFRWAYGWVEDINRFDIANIALWMMIAMGISIRFRSMNNREFSCWMRTIFINTDQIRQLYNRFKRKITKTLYQ